MKTRIGAETVLVMRPAPLPPFPLYFFIAKTARDGWISK
jgi:hypothetical protein